MFLRQSIQLDNGKGEYERKIDRLIHIASLLPCQTKKQILDRVKYICRTNHRSILD